MEDSPTPPKRRWTAVKTALMLIIALAVFGGGIWVGRHNSQKLTSPGLDYSSVNKVYQLLSSKFDGRLDQTKILDGLKSGLAASAGDPYTVYLNPEQAKDFEDQLRGSFSGIGLELDVNKQKQIVVVSPLAGYPAAKAGLKPKDVIAAVDGRSTADWSIDATVRAIRGPVGTPVKLAIIRGQSEPFTVAIARVKIKIPSVGSKVDGSIGYLRISQFSDDTVDLATKAAQKFRAEGVRAVVLDLRGNPGGYLESAVKIASLWLDSGQTVVSERRGSEVVSNQTATGNNILKGLPTVVLIDGGSASASEITAGALRDNHAATLVGVKSFGKGSVQNVECLDGQQLDGGCSGAELKITIARWYTPAGKNIDQAGIKPDVSVKLSDSEIKQNQDRQKDKAYAILKQKIH